MSWFGKRSERRLKREMRGRVEEEEDDDDSAPPAQNQLQLLLAICCGACVSIVLVLGFVVGLFVYVIWGSIILSGSKDLKWGGLSDEWWAFSWHFYLLVNFFFFLKSDTVEIAYIWWYVLYCVLITMFEILYFSYGAWVTCWKGTEGWYIVQFEIFCRHSFELLEPDTMAIQSESKQTIQQKLSSFQVSSLINLFLFFSTLTYLTQNVLTLSERWSLHSHLPRSSGVGWSTCL